MKHPQISTPTAHDVLLKKKSANTSAKSAGLDKSKAISSGNGREEMIRQIAYSFYESRCYEDGHSLLER